MGSLATDSIHISSTKVGDTIQALNLESKQLKSGKVTKVYVTRGTVKSVGMATTASDTITIAGINAFVSDTICDAAISEPIPSPTMDPPTMDPPTISMKFSMNDSPIVDKEGNLITPSHIR